MLLTANPMLSSVAQARRIARGASTFPRRLRREIRTEADAAATQIGQLKPGAAENRSAAPTAEVKMERDQIIAAELSAIIS